MTAFILIALLAASLSVTAQDAERLQFADGLYAREMYDVAAKEYGACLHEFPKAANADVLHFRLGECYRHLGNLAAAEKEFRRVFSDYPESSFRLWAGFKRADLFMEAEQYADAADLFQTVLREKPPPDVAAASLFFLGSALIELQEPGEAVKAFNAVVARYTATKYYSYALLKLGALHSRPAKPGAKETTTPAPAQDLEQALSFLEKAAAKPWSDRIAAEALFQMAEIRFRRGAYAESAEAYRDLLKKYPLDERCAEARLQDTWAAHNAGLYAEALARADEVLKGDVPDSEKAEWLYLKANCERQLLKHEAAVDTYAGLLKIHPTGRFANAARYEKALTFYKRGMFDEARAEALKIDLNSDLKKDVYWLLAESFSALKEENEAIQYYRLLIRDFPKSELTCDATYRLANHLRSQGENKDASRYYNVVVAEFPKSDLAPRSLLASGYCLKDAKMDAEAVRDWARLARGYASSPLVEEALYRKVMGEIRLERVQDALASLDGLLSKFPKTKFLGDAHFWKGALLEKLDKTQDAEAAFRQCLAVSPGKDLERAAQFSLGHILHQAGKEKEAAAIFHGLLASPLRGKFTPALVRWLAEYSIDQKNYDGAVKAAQTLVETRGEPAWQQIGWGLMGRAEFVQGRKQQAEEDFRKCLDTDATTDVAPEAALRLGEIVFEKKDYESAEKHFDKALILASGEELVNVRARAWAGLGRVSEMQEKHGNAARCFMFVAVLFDDPELVPDCLHRAAQSLRKVGREEEASRAEKELSDRYPKSKWALQPGKAD